MLVALSQPHFAPLRLGQSGCRPGERICAARCVLRARGPESSVGRGLRHQSQCDRLRGRHEPRHDRRPAGPPQRMVASAMCSRRCARRRSSTASTPAASSTITPRAIWARCTRATSMRTSRRSRRCRIGSSTGRRRVSNRCSRASTACPCRGTGRCTAAGIRANGSSAAPRSRGNSAWPNGTPSSSATGPTRSATRRRPTCAGRPGSSGRAGAGIAGTIPIRWARTISRNAIRCMRSTSPTIGRPFARGKCRPTRRGTMRTTGRCDPGVDKGRQQLPVDWQNLQRPGFSPDYMESRYETMDLSFERADWIPTVAAQALMRNNRPLLAYIAGKPAAFTSKDHIFYPGETVEKQLIVINNSRETVAVHVRVVVRPAATAGRHTRGHGGHRTARSHCAAIRVARPTGSGPLRAASDASVSAPARSRRTRSRWTSCRAQCSAVACAQVALFDPHGETRQLLRSWGFHTPRSTRMRTCRLRRAGRGKERPDGRRDPAPEITRVRDGLKVILFEQTPDVLEKRFGFRVAAYGLRQVFRRMPDHPALAGLGRAAPAQLARGGDDPSAATRVPGRLPNSAMRRRSGGAASRSPALWRCGNRGNVASVLIEKPARGDFLPILDGGYSLQYSPLIEYREGQGMVLFCQMDVTGRTESDPAAETLARNMLEYAAAWKPAPRRTAVYVGDPAWKSHLESAGISVSSYQAANRPLMSPGRGTRRRTATRRSMPRRFANGWKRAGTCWPSGSTKQEAKPSCRCRSARTAPNTSPPISNRRRRVAVGGRESGGCPQPGTPRVAVGVVRTSTVRGRRHAGRCRSRSHVVFCQLPPDSVDPALGSCGAESAQPEANLPPHMLPRGTPAGQSGCGRHDAPA